MRGDVVVVVAVAVVVLVGMVAAAAVVAVVIVIIIVILNCCHHHHCYGDNSDVKIFINDNDDKNSESDDEANSYGLVFHTFTKF
jgi:hypothetical protein